MLMLPPDALMSKLETTCLNSLGSHHALLKQPSSAIKPYEN
jgi:hypothetical protein